METDKKDGTAEEEERLDFKFTCKSSCFKLDGCVHVTLCFFVML